MASFFKISAITTICLICFIAEAAAINSKYEGGFSANLIHRDSLLSPLYNPSQTDTQRLHNSFIRSVSRTNSFQTPLLSNGPDYFMNISIGTPPVEVFGMVDFHSDFIWVPCRPCEGYCYGNLNTPIFHSNQSSTFRNVTCGSKYCQQFYNYCTDENLPCRYVHRDLGGNVGMEKFTVGSISLPNIAFGCGSVVPFMFGEQEGLLSGIIGFSTSPVSLVSQLNTSGISGKFSYCLVPSLSSKVPSKINFGGKALVSAPSASGVISTPLVPSHVEDTNYYVQVEAISVGNKRIPYTTSTGYPGHMVEKGNLEIDFGRSLTSIDSGVFDKMVTTLEESFGSERVIDPAGFLSACYSSKLSDSDLPNITFHFSGGGDLKLQSYNSFIRLQEASEDFVCLNMLPSNDPYYSANLGNLSQANLLVEFDLEEMIVSFMPTDCTNQ